MNKILASSFRLNRFWNFRRLPYELTLLYCFMQKLNNRNLQEKRISWGRLHLCPALLPSSIKCYGPPTWHSIPTLFFHFFRFPFPHYLFLFGSSLHFQIRCRHHYVMGSHDVLSVLLIRNKFLFLAVILSFDF